MGRESSTHKELKRALEVLLQNLKERDHLEELGADGSVILKQCR
jgi:hypothetical protein